MAVITILRQNGTVGFDPSPLTINQGDVIVFRNEDPEAQHLITRTGQGANFWFQYPLAPFVAGQPADTSDEVFFAITKDPAPPLTVTYAGSGGETQTGTVVVVDPRYK